ncbi:DMT family transporter [Inediibacterium massiliense]|uniref:DMT family transporter n=1 Tax=Inediibacterium massiliense TaxID=1658111 RepID=UPI0006B57D34|nr:DMT family transporter [Inediibacterium massiliense]
MKNKSEIIFTKNYVIMIMAVISCFLWGSAFPSIKIGYNLFDIDGNNPYQKIMFAGLRFLLSSVMVFIFCILTKRSLRLKKADLQKVTILGLIQTAIQYMFFYIGLSNTSSTKGSILSATATFFSVILAHFFYSEDRLTIRKIIGVILGFLGVVIVNISGNNIQSGFLFIGEGFVIISSLMGAIAGIYTKKIAKDINTFAISGYQLFTGSLFLILIGFLGGGQRIIITTENYGLLIYLSFISAGAFSLWTVLLKYNGVGKVTIYKFTTPLFGVMLSYIFLGERLLGLSVVLSIILVSISIIMINIEKAYIKELQTQLRHRS